MCRVLAVYLFAHYLGLRPIRTRTVTSDFGAPHEPPRSFTHPHLFPKIDVEKQLVVAQGGITLQRLHATLDAHGLAMINVGSISDQTLAGMVTTATHGTGLTHKVLSTHVQALHLLLADGSHVRCSRSENPDLSIATICGLGSTGLILDIQLKVAPAFRLHEVQETVKFDPVVDRLDEVANSAEYVRLWWWPQAGDIRVSSMSKTDEVRPFAVYLPWRILTYLNSQKAL